ncbi:hypothetical protein [Paraburkholderia tropica]|uniref:hypothetical protein n=1 Tax=Paraburkholderia tropica TaxID=92647 RepID=UPI002AB28B2D|nr:hypothetical protein [Paraburkholderia tropica]
MHSSLGVLLDAIGRGATRLHVTRASKRGEARSRTDTLDLTTLARASLARRERVSRDAKRAKQSAAMRAIGADHKVLCCARRDAPDRRIAGSPDLRHFAPSRAASRSGRARCRDALTLAR